MVRSGADSFLQGGFPYGEGLPRNGEHEIHVDMGHSRIFSISTECRAWAGVCSRPSRCRMPESRDCTPRETRVMPRLRQKRTFFRKGGGVGLKGEFVQFVHGHETVQGFHETPQMRVREHGGRSPAKVKRDRFPSAVRGQSGCAGFRLPAQSTDE